MVVEHQSIESFCNIDCANKRFFRNFYVFFSFFVQTLFVPIFHCILSLLCVGCKKNYLFAQKHRRTYKEDDFKVEILCVCEYHTKLRLDLSGKMCNFREKCRERGDKFCGLPVFDFTQIRYRKYWRERTVIYYLLTIRVLSSSLLFR